MRLFHNPLKFLILSLLSASLTGSVAVNPNSSISKENYLEKSLEFANRIDGKREKSDTLSVISSHLAKTAQKFDDAIEIALTIPRKSMRARTLNGIAVALAEKGLIGRAIETVLQCSKLKEKISGLCDVSVSIKDDQAKRKLNRMIMDYMVNDLVKNSDVQLVDDCLDIVAQEFIYQGECELASTLSKLFYDYAKKDYILSKLVSNYSSDGNLDRAFELAKLASKKSSREYCFAIISESMIYKIENEQVCSETNIQETATVDFSDQLLKKM